MREHTRGQTAHYCSTLCSCYLQALQGRLLALALRTLVFVSIHAYPLSLSVACSLVLQFFTSFRAQSRTDTSQYTTDSAVHQAHLLSTLVPQNGFSRLLVYAKFPGVGSPVQQLSLRDSWCVPARISAMCARVSLHALIRRRG